MSDDHWTVVVPGTAAASYAHAGYVDRDEALREARRHAQAEITRWTDMIRDLKQSQNQNGARAVTINWEAAQVLSDWLDSEVAPGYQEQPLAQDWARISKVAEETGEAIAAFVGATGQNPRKGTTHSMDDVLSELADVALTGIYAMVHFAGADLARDLLAARQRRHHQRIGLPFDAVG